MPRKAIVVIAPLLLLSCSTAEPTPDRPASTPGEPAPTSSSSTPLCDEPCYGDPETVGMVRPKVASSISGIAASVRNPGVYYVVGDEEGTASVGAVSEDGSRVATFEVEGLSARNAEALAVGPCDQGDESCLYIGDIGNHVGLEDLFVYRVREPDVAAQTGSVPADMWRYTYPGEPTDAEALIVSNTGAPVVISKAAFDEESGETAPTQVFRGKPGGGELAKSSEFELPEPESGLLAQFVGNVVTGADSAEGRVILRTYDEVIEYRADDPEADLAAFPDWERRRVPSAGQLQSEAVTYRADGCGYLTVSERQGTIASVTCVSE